MVSSQPEIVRLPKDKITYEVDMMHFFFLSNIFIEKSIRRTVNCIYYQVIVPKKLNR